MLENSSRDRVIPAQPEMEAIESIARFTVIPDQSVEVVLITLIPAIAVSNTVVKYFQGAEYEGLMEANPVWAPLKPADTFRIEDLFAYIDYLAEKEGEDDHPVP